MNSNPARVSRSHKPSGSIDKTDTTDSRKETKQGTTLLSYKKGLNADAIPRSIKPNKHTFTCSGTSFTVNPRYNYIKQVGHGAYGVVCSATDSKGKTKVAIKKVTFNIRYPKLSKTSLTPSGLSERLSCSSFLTTKILLRSQTSKNQKVALALKTFT
jgi:hypothetical protein